ncbi:MAG TPA: hypothetical protein VN915_11500 [Elusimicrobiota bacterium]|nr:hypothetical protein [Elusimicrobiota bacterium]
MTIKKTDNPFAGLESGVSGAILGAGRGAKAVVDSVAGVLTGALKGSTAAHAALLDEARSLADSAVRGAAKVGADVGTVGRGFLLGALRGSGLDGEPALHAAGQGAGAFMTSVLSAGGDPSAAAAAATGLVEGAMVWAGEVGQDAARAACAVGQAAVDAAYEADARVGQKVRDALRVPIAGVTIVLTEPRTEKKQP